MPYIGQAPAPKVITSSDLSADVVTEAKIADNAVENEHLNANVITGHTALGATPADTDELLVSDAGTLKRVDFSYLKGGGAFEKLITTTVSSPVASLEFNNTYFTTAHVDYQLRIVDFRGSAGAVPFFQISSDNGSSYKSGSGSNGYRFGYFGCNEASGTFNTGSGGNDDANFLLPINSDGFHGGTTQAVSMIIDIFDPLNTQSDAKLFNFMASSVNLNSSDDINYMAGGGIYNGSGDEDTAFNAIKIDMDSGNIDGGTFTLYGRKI